MIVSKKNNHPMKTKERVNSRILLKKLRKLINRRKFKILALLKMTMT
jgi:hypothetical protein